MKLHAPIYRDAKYPQDLLEVVEDGPTIGYRWLEGPPDGIFHKSSFDFFNAFEYAFDLNQGVSA